MQNKKEKLHDERKQNEREKLLYSYSVVGGKNWQKKALRA